MDAVREIGYAALQMTERCRTILDEPHVAFGREVCGDLAAGLRREWLVTNGLGGYASASLAGVPTRTYHGLLVAALEPPVARRVLVAGLVEWATYDGRRVPLSTHEFGDGTFAPDGYRHLESFRLEGTLPVWTFAVADALLERRLWMPHGRNTTYVSFRLTRASRALDLELTPLVTDHDFHALRSGDGWAPLVEPGAHGALVRADERSVAVRLLSNRAAFQPGGAWWWNFRHREETARGLNDRGDLYAPGTFAARLAPGESLILAFSIEEDVDLDGARTLEEEQTRQVALLHQADATSATPPVQQLVLAADQFIVSRSSAVLSAQFPVLSLSACDGCTDRETASSDDLALGTEHWALGKSVIAGYHWFNDWGRDTMIALPGLTLATGRAEDAAGILRTFACYLADGLLPNNFPDRSGQIPGYNTVDATLWYVLAIRAYHEATGDASLVADLLPALVEIVERHLAGTRHGIGVDPSDGLVRAGEPGVQLTWMDAKVGDWVVTPRIGKPVEINALWYNALRTLTGFVRRAGDLPTAARYDALADQARDSFRARFRRPDLDHLADVVDGPAGDDWSLRPNQVFALSLPFRLLEGEEAAAVLGAVGRALLTSHGLRSLAPDDPAYRGDYGGDAVRRDGGYHQGPVWTWLIGAYAEAVRRLTGDREAALSVLRPFADHLRDAGLGSVSEILEGDPPHLPRGCVAQAWGVAEVLRVWRLLSESGRD